MEKHPVLEIEKIVYGGLGLGRAEGKVVFVPFTAPGDRVTVRIVKEKKNYLEAALQSLERPSEMRVRPFCGVFGRCGGCHLQHIGYENQVAVKEENLKGFLRRLRQQNPFEVLPVLRAPQDRGYRIRAQLKAAPADGRWDLGFYESESHRVVPIVSCPLLHPLANRMLGDFRERLERAMPVRGLRGVDLLVSPEEKKGIIRLVGGKGGGGKALRSLLEGSPFLKGFEAAEEKDGSWGDPDLSFSLPGSAGKGVLRIEVPARSFFQVNPDQNRNLIRRVGEWAGLTGREKVLDLFCGAGNLTLPLAGKAAKVWGVDTDQAAVGAAAKNARKNSLENCFFRAAPAKAGIAWVLREAKKIDLAVLDPPRAGAADVLEDLAELRPQKILYVSCEPPTLARDLAALGARGYTLTRVQPLDMFPHTYHLETIAELQILP